LRRNRNAFSNRQRDVKIEFLSYKVKVPNGHEDVPDGVDEDVVPSDEELLLDNRQFLILQLSLKEWLKETF
jgi:hypothetical protein